MANQHNRSVADPAGFEEELSRISAEDQARLFEVLELERIQQLESQRQKQRLDNLKQQALEVAKHEAKEAAKEAAKKALKRAAERYGLRALFLNPWTWIVVTIVALVLGMILLFFMATTVACNKPESVFGGGWTGKITVFIAQQTANYLGGSILSGTVQREFCGYLTIPNRGNTPTRPLVANTEGPQDISSEQQARNYLAAYNISVNRPCVNILQNVTQTCLEGIFQRTLDEIVQFKLGCDSWVRRQGLATECEVVFTGGTEPGHSTVGTCTHANGYKFDMRVNNLVDAYILQARSSDGQLFFQPAGSRSNGDPLYQNVSTGSLYAREPDHWDVAVCYTNETE